MVLSFNELVKYVKINGIKQGNYIVLDTIDNEQSNNSNNKGIMALQVSIGVVSEQDNDKKVNTDEKTVMISSKVVMMKLLYDDMHQMLMCNLMSSEKMRGNMIVIDENSEVFKDTFFIIDETKHEFEKSFCERFPDKARKIARKSIKSFNDEIEEKNELIRNTARCINDIASKSEKLKSFIHSIELPEFMKDIKDNDEFVTRCGLAVKCSFVINGNPFFETLEGNAVVEAGYMFETDDAGYVEKDQDNMLDIVGKKKMHKIIVISSPSGGGKNSVINEMMKQQDFCYAKSATTRAPRKNEKEGDPYYFMSVDEFKKKIKNNEFVEHEEVYDGVFYGTLKSEINQLLNKGDVLLDLDVKGALSMKRLYLDRCMTVFLDPISIDVLEKRLRNRGTDSEEQIKERLGKARYEMTFADQFDYRFVNDNVETVAKNIINNFKRGER